MVFLANARSRLRQRINKTNFRSIIGLVTGSFCPPSWGIGRWWLFWSQLVCGIKVNIKQAIGCAAFWVALNIADIGSLSFVQAGWNHTDLPATFHLAMSI